MSTNTANYSFIKPALTDNISNTIPALASNFDSLDTELKSQDTRINNIVGYSGTSNVEVVDSRSSGVKSTTYATLDARLEASEQEFQNLGFINVKDFPYLAVGDGITDDTLSIQTAINAAIAGGCNIVFPSGNTYLVSQIIFSNDTRTRRLEVDLSGAIIKGSSTTTPVIIKGTYWDIKNLRITNNGGAVYSCSIGWLWHSTIDGLYTGDSGNVEITPYLVNYGTYWNTFRNWHIGHLYFKTDIYSINHNSWFGGKIAGITTLTPNLDCYNNVFENIDIVGGINHAHTDQPIILRNCNFEGAFSVTGYIIHNGGAYLWSPNSEYIDYSTPKNIIHGDVGAGNGMGNNYIPETYENVLVGGDGSRMCPQMTIGGVSSVYFSLYATGNLIFDTSLDRVVGSSVVHRLNFSGSVAYPRIYITFPTEYLSLAIKSGFASFSFWMKIPSGSSTFANILYNINGGSDVYPKGFTYSSADVGNWKQCWINVPVSSTTTSVSVSILFVGSTVECLFDGLCAMPGRSASLFKRNINELNGFSYSKYVTANGVSQDLFSFPVSAYTSGQIIIDVQSNSSAHSVCKGYKRVAISYADNAVGVTDLGGVGNSNAGAVNSITAAINTGVVTVSVTPNAYGGSPSIKYDYSVEFKTRQENITLI